MRPTRWTRAGAALAAQGRLLAYGLGELGARPRHAERFSIAYNIGRLPLGGSSLSSLTGCRFHALSLSLCASRMGVVRCTGWLCSSLALSMGGFFFALMLRRLMFGMRLFDSTIFDSAEGVGPNRLLSCGVVCRSHGCTLRPVCLADTFAAQRQLSMSHTPVVASPTATSSSSRIKKVYTVNSTATARPGSFDAS